MKTEFVNVDEVKIEKVIQQPIKPKEMKFGSILEFDMMVQK